MLFSELPCAATRLTNRLELLRKFSQPACPAWPYAIDGGEIMKKFSILLATICLLGTCVTGAQARHYGYFGVRPYGGFYNGYGYGYGNGYGWGNPYWVGRGVYYGRPWGYHHRYYRGW